jgi:hypothetical protein
MRFFPGLQSRFFVRELDTLILHDLTRHVGSSGIAATPSTQGGQGVPIGDDDGGTTVERGQD